ncbi:DNA methyltransferase [Fannyhessea vaginae]|uniref:DNA (Cytosine-5-)-methyltransferase n=1 Tax=Fannyhessea vaginae DSM 15829 TaxID=525256 RepID=F1T6F9_9ACTN|nr:site-specific DNA-methyltransferase [Fannyhessea vaginae]EGF22853.1 DNA (cytosine-5-)-methyltransferase [Fannyhessea vaginae DSM 15829]QPR42219.1 site-specific DNA-methyltransferase [Fannyhessea vaginae]SSZ02298.1 Modification methylase MboII [Fannyhessea vaginae]
MKNIFDTVAELLLTNDKYKAEDGKLLKAVVYSDVMAMSEDLLALLLSNEDIKETFFKAVQGTLVFDKQKFAWFMESKEFLPDSYTAYTNKIGLTHNGSFISQTNDVVLEFPYKDCVLEGGQDKDDQKRSEIFYNETIASDEISRMLAPKVFTNAKRYTAVGEKDLLGNLDPNTINVEEETGITFKSDDNLIIKGNNLIALASLLKRYEGKVKCIYIDPPYYFNKTIGEDSFKYNSNFKMSTWLTFMKNRLELANKLLSSHGSIWIHMGEDGMHYLKVLADDVFGKEHFVGTIPRKTRDGKSDVPFNLSQDFDWILVYTKANESDAVVGRQVERKYYETDDFPGKPWRTADLTSQRTVQERPNSDFTMINPKTGKEYPVNPKRSWAVTKDTFDEWYASGGIGFPDDYEFMSGNRPFRRVFKEDDDCNEKPTSVNSDFLIKEFIATLLTKSKNKDGNNEITNLFSRDEFDYAKPEELIRSILEISSNPTDLVLDFHLGSGTTAAVAHKMGRRYIGVEQMDYIQDITVERLKKVLEGEQGGISKAQNWHGGGSFVYCELKEGANTLITTIQNATEDTIESVKASIYTDERIVPYLTKQELADADKDFENLTLEEKKQVLSKLVDKNKLYVNASDMDDETYQISDTDKAFTTSFYKEVR